MNPTAPSDLLRQITKKKTKSMPRNARNVEAPPIQHLQARLRCKATATLKGTPQAAAPARRKRHQDNGTEIYCEPLALLTWQCAIKNVGNRRQGSQFFWTGLAQRGQPCPQPITSIHRAPQPLTFIHRIRPSTPHLY